MARRKRKHNQHERDNSTSIANRRLHHALSVRPSVVTWKDIEDRRRFDPTDGLLPARTFTSRDAGRVTLTPVKHSGVGSRKSGRDVHKFAVPADVVICARRKERREVLFAYRRTGKGARSLKRRTPYSDFSCRR